MSHPDYEPRLLDEVLAVMRQPFRIVESVVGVDAWCDRCIICQRLADRETAAFWFGAHAAKHHREVADTYTIDWLT